MPRYVYVTVNGTTQSQSDWARQIGITREAFRLRMLKGLPDNLLVAPKYAQFRPRLSKYRRLYGKTLAEMAEMEGVSTCTIQKRMRRANGRD